MINRQSPPASPVLSPLRYESGRAERLGGGNERLGGGIVTCMGTFRPPTPYLKGLGEINAHHDSKCAHLYVDVQK